MIVFGLILTILGYALGIGVLYTIGEILLAIGVVLLVVGYAHGPVFGDRRYWF